MSFKPAFTFINAKELATLLRNSGVYSPTLRKPRVDGLRKENKLAIVDVRDDDHEGGHIKGCIHSPSSKFLDGGVESIREKTKDIPTVVFHCALSQVRGPKAARIYAETTDEVRKRGGEAPILQEVLVLRGGFTDFQALYRHDKNLVEDWDEDFWS